MPGRNVLPLPRIRVERNHLGFGETPRGIAQHPTLGLASQLYLARDGRYTLCGVGIAWHAGESTISTVASKTSQPVIDSASQRASRVELTLPA